VSAYRTVQVSNTDAGWQYIVTVYIRRAYHSLQHTHFSNMSSVSDDASWLALVDAYRVYGYFIGSWTADWTVSVILNLIRLRFRSCLFCCGFIRLG
jgi:hypothetical protein